MRAAVSSALVSLRRERSPRVAALPKVSDPTMASGFSPCVAWKARVALAVFGPKMPSRAPGENPLDRRTCCHRWTSGPRWPCRRLRLFVTSFRTLHLARHKTSVIKPGSYPFEPFRNERRVHSQDLDTPRPHTNTSNLL